jgi:hypothetical protein
VTIASGIRSARARDLSGTTGGQAKAKATSWWAIAGLVFTFIHFGFGNSVCYLVLVICFSRQYLIFL